jgi:N-acetyl-anhydromuramyl-L-alanine amidase AmpD
MSNPNENESKTESMLSNLLKFFFIFFILVVIVILIPFTGILNSDETTTSTPLASIQTLPPLTTTNSQVIATTTERPTTETTLAVTTENTTANSSTYPPATVPTGNKQTTASTTLAATTTEQITTETTPLGTTASTAESSTYPPATVPTGNTQTTASTTLAATTQIPTNDLVIDFQDISDEAMQELIEVRYLSIDENSRSGEKLWRVDNIVVHYVANPRSTADQNWRNFENNKPGTSAHFIIGLEGEIIQCMPLDEVAWAIGTEEGNYTSISIECCHPDATGKFTDATLESLTKLVSWLCKELDLGRDDVVRHYDYPRQASWGVWHKQCPLYYANDNDPASHKRWEAFKDSLLID